MADGTKIVEPVDSNNSQLTTVDSHEVDFGGGDIRDRQRVMLAGANAADDVATAASTPTGTERGLVTRLASGAPNGVTIGTLVAAAAATAAQVYAPTANATAVIHTVPDGHSSSMVEITGTFSPGSQVVFEQSSDTSQGGLPADNTWAATNMRRNTTPDVNEAYSQIDNNPSGTSNVQIWKGTVGGAKFFRVRCAAFQTGDSIAVRILTSTGVGGTFLLGNPPSVSDYFATGTLSAIGQAVEVKTGGMGSWAAYMSGQFTGTVYFEASIDGTNWLPINGAVQGAGSLQQSIVGTNAVGQTLQVRGSAGGLTKVRLRAGADFAGTFTGTLRSGAGSGGIFLTAPAPIAGLTLAQTQRLSVGTTAGRLDTNPLTGRTSVEIQYLASGAANGGWVRVGFGAGLTALNGRELQPGESWTIDLQSNVQIWAIASNAAQAVQLTEVGN